MGKARFHLLAFVVVAIWGMTFVSTKMLLAAGLLPAQIFLLRFIVAYLGIWLLCISGSPESSRFFSGSVRDELLMVLLGVSGGSAYFLTENTALACTQACNVSFIVCSAPLLTALLSIAVKKCLKGELADGVEDVKGRWPLLVGTLLALCGMAAVIFDGNSLEISVRGDLLAFAAALCWGLYSTFMGQMTRKYGALFSTRKVFFYGLLTIIPFVVGRPLDFSVFAQPQVWMNLLFLSLLASLACFVLWNKVIAGLGNITATNYVYLNPFFTLLAAVLFLGESLTLQSAIGCAAIVLGVIIGGIKK